MVAHIGRNPTWTQRKIPERARIQPEVITRLRIIWAARWRSPIPQGIWLRAMPMTRTGTHLLPAQTATSMRTPAGKTMATACTIIAPATTIRRSVGSSARTRLGLRAGRMTYMRTYSTARRTSSILLDCLAAVELVEPVPACRGRDVNALTAKMVLADGGSRISYSST